MKRVPTLSVLFSFPGFRARSRLRGIFGDPHAWLVTLVRRKKRRCVRVAGGGIAPSTTAGRVAYGIPTPRAGASIWRSNNGGWPAHTVRG
jgi:hypothetical protein